ncbi:class C sortase [Xylanimonas allomyrinae]|uniref:class C sortase n=1 Tax=Xylanimonas allomyrinae TaxID=2509459 RepID=UPI0013A639E3|nr:class C sortase [Xylanimonas allomyrinae]
MSRRTFALVTLVAIGAGLLLFPTASRGFATRDQSRSLASYGQAVTALPDAEQQRLLAAAHEYNARLARGDRDGGDGTGGSYRAQLAPPGGTIMAALTIPSLRLALPVLHDTGDEVPARGAAHLHGTSLPVGGRGTHAVISAHSGLAGAELFTHLDRVEVGAVFTLDVAGRRLVYEVDSIAVVEPDDDSLLHPVPDQDLVTLVTCTPTGLSTHRLLVRGHRTFADDGPHATHHLADASAEPGVAWWSATLVVSVVGAAFVGCALDRADRARARHLAGPPTERTADVTSP